MAFPIPDDIKERAVTRCELYGHVELVDPGTVYTTPDEKTLVTVRDKITKLIYWLEV